MSINPLSIFTFYIGQLYPMSVEKIDFWSDLPKTAVVWFPRFTLCNHFNFSPTPLKSQFNDARYFPNFGTNGDLAGISNRLPRHLVERGCVIWKGIVHLKILSYCHQYHKQRYFFSLFFQWSSMSHWVEKQSTVASFRSIFYWSSVLHSHWPIFGTSRG